jgi:hypothetical protein
VSITSEILMRSGSLSEAPGLLEKVRTSRSAIAASCGTDRERRLRLRELNACKKRQNPTRIPYSWQALSGYQAAEANMPSAEYFGSTC